MPSFLQQPNYEDFPLRLSQGLWQHSSRWEPTDFDYCARSGRTRGYQIFARPKVYQHRRRPSPGLDASWIYKEDDKGPPRGWAELQSFPSKNFGKGLLFFEFDGIAEEHAREALIALVSLVFTLSRNDHLHIIPGKAGRPLIDALSHYTGTMETLTSLPVHPWHPEAAPLQGFPCLEVDRNSWRQCAALQEALRSFKHVEMRLERLQRLEQKHPRKARKRPFLVRLFKPRIDDPLF